ncbi:MAG TPA: hypothetical protein VFV50_04495 [Bdellovibrionales bacterium]|nr:hypothetical protein [Bdellovibrionales bacterium]
MSAYRVKTALALAALCMMALGYNNCGNVSFMRNEPASIDRGPEGTTIGNPMLPMSVRPYQVTAVPWAFKVCVDSISAKTVSGTRVVLFTGPTMIEFKPEGTDIPIGAVPAGTYEAIMIDVQNTCGGVRSTLLCNSNSGGACFETADSYKMAFFGTVTRDGVLTGWTVDMQPIASELEQVTAPAEIAPLFSSVSGTF